MLVELDGEMMEILEISTTETTIITTKTVVVMEPMRGGYDKGNNRGNFNGNSNNNWGGDDDNEGVSWRSSQPSTTYENQSTRGGYTP